MSGVFGWMVSGMFGWMVSSEWRVWMDVWMDGE